MDEKKTKSNHNIFSYTSNNNLDFLIPKHLKRKINNFLKTSLNNVNKDLEGINNYNFRKSLSINNPYQHHFSLNNGLGKSLYETDRQNNEKEELQEIKEVNKETSEKVVKDKNGKIPIRKNKMIGTIIVKDTKQVLEKIKEKINKENSIKKKDYQTLNKSINIYYNKEINSKKIDEIEDINAQEFNLEDDAPINISINNITKTFNSSNYITTNSDSNPDKKLNLSDSD